MSQMLFNCVMESPVDCRPDLLKSIVLSGAQHCPSACPPDILILLEDSPTVICTGWGRRVRQPWCLLSVQLSGAASVGKLEISQAAPTLRLIFVARLIKWRKQSLSGDTPHQPLCHATTLVRVANADCPAIEWGLAASLTTSLAASLTTSPRLQAGRLCTRACRRGSRRT